MLDGKHAVITGAGRNVGRGIAQSFAEYGARVAVNDVKAERCEETIRTLADHPDGDHLALPGDGTDPSVIEAFAERVDEEFGGIDVLVNNLGYAVNKNVFDTTEAEWDTVQDLTLKSGFLWTKHLGPLLIDPPGGAIVNMASGLGHSGQTEKVAYCAAKGGVLNMTRQLALDFAEYDVRVNSISPGRVGDAVGTETGAEGRGHQGIPLERVGRPQDIGNAAVFLASDLSAYVTGADLKVDGGLSL